MSLLPAPWRAHPPTSAHHPVTLQDLAIFAGGLIIAVMVGVAASGVLPS